MQLRLKFIKPDPNPFKLIRIQLKQTYFIVHVIQQIYHKFGEFFLISLFFGRSTV